MQTSLRSNSNYHNYYSNYGNTNNIHDQPHQQDLQQPQQQQQQQENQLLQYNPLDQNHHSIHHVNDGILNNNDQHESHHYNASNCHSYNSQHHQQISSYQTIYYEPITQFNQNDEDYELVRQTNPFTSCDQLVQHQTSNDVCNFNSQQPLQQQQQQHSIGLEFSSYNSTGQHYENTNQCFTTTTTTTTLCNNDHQQISYNVQQPTYHNSQSQQDDLCTIDQASTVVYHNLEQINSTNNNDLNNQLSSSVLIEQSKQAINNDGITSLRNQYLQHNDEISNLHCSLRNDDNNRGDEEEQEAEGQEEEEEEVDDDDDDDDDDDNLCTSEDASEGGRSTPYSEGSANSTLTRDEKRAREANIPLTYYEIVNLSIDQFNDQLAKHKLSEGQLTLIKDIRRRGKNKVAAQSCRKRKMEQIYELQHEVEQLANKRRSLSCEKSQLQEEHANLIQKYDKIYNFISLFRGNVTN